MALTEVERTSALRHLGYTVLTTPTSLSLGTPRITQADFIATQNLLNLTPASEALVRDALGKLDCFEAKLASLATDAELVATGQIKFDPAQAIETVEQLYRRWQHRLADMLGCRINPLSIKDGTRGVIEPC